MLFSPIHHTFGPLVDAEQRKLARKVRKGNLEKDSLKIFTHELKAHFNAEAFCFASGRQSLLAGLKAAGIQEGDEVIVQGYTCVTVPNPILALGAKPIFADIEKDTLNLDLEDTEKKITDRTKAIICQHTFGIPADTERLRELCNAQNILLIEDCAHVLPDAKGPARIGMQGDLVMLSFGRDKAISGIAGGALLVRNKGLLQNVTEIWEQAGQVPLSELRTLLLYPQIYHIAKPLYGIFLGKLFLKLCAKLGLLLPITGSDEKTGSMSTTLQKLPEECAELALAQLRRLAELNDHKRKITAFYVQSCKDHGWMPLDGITEDLPLQKFPMFIPNAEKIRILLKKKNIHLDDGWTGCTICPRSVDAQSTGYESGTDPCAEEIAMQILSLPTHPTMTLKEAQYLIHILSAII